MINIEDKVNERLLEELTIYEEKIYSDDSVNGFSNKLDHYNRSWIVWLIWPYGSGKSTFLEDVKNQKILERDSVWVHFDAWKYPERKELRDWFVMEMVEQILPDRFIEVKKYIQTGKKETQRVFEKALHIAKLIPAGIGDVLQSVLTQEWVPITKIYEYEKLLQSLLFELDQDVINTGEEIWKTTKTIYVVLEDVDRSGDEWMYFLETLNNFIRRYYTSHTWSSIYYRMVCICPIAESSLHENFDRYLKVLDIYDYFTVHVEYNLSLYLDKIFNFEDPFKSILYEVCIEGFRKSDYNFRRFKFILRYIIKEYKHNCSILGGSLDIEWFLFLNIMFISFSKEWSNLKKIIEFKVDQFSNSSKEHALLVKFLNYKIPSNWSFSARPQDVYEFKIEITPDEKEVSLYSSTTANQSLIKISPRYTLQDLQHSGSSRRAFV